MMYFLKRKAMRRLLAASLLALLVSGLYYVWNERSGAGSHTLQRAGVKETKEKYRPDKKAGKPEAGTVKPTDHHEGKAVADQPGSMSATQEDPETVTRPEGRSAAPSKQPLADTVAQASDNQKRLPDNVEAQYHNVCPPQSAGHVFSSEAASELSDSVFVVNGLSSLGARVTRMLASINTQRDVVSVSSTKDRSYGDQLVWYRQDVLRGMGIPSVFVDWSDSNAVGMLLKGRRPGHVIIIPPAIDGEMRYTMDSTMWAAALHDFVALLEAVRTVSPATRLTLVSVSKSVKNELVAVPAGGGEISILETLVGAFELSLSTYHTLYQIPFSILRVKGLYGPWTHNGLGADSSKASAPAVGCYIDNVVRIVYSSLSLDFKCIVLDFGSCDDDTSRYGLEKVGVTKLIGPSKGRELAEIWRKKFNGRRNSRVVLTSYFTGSGFHIAPNRFQALQRWLESVSSFELKAVILHNGLDNDFIAHSMKRYQHLSFKFISLPHDFSRNSSCLQSVNAFANYLEHHAGIERVIVTDLGKMIKRDTFPAMEELGDWLYSDVDIIPFRDVAAQTAGSQGDGDILADSLVLGGSRHTVLATLNKMATCLESGSRPSNSLQCLVDRRFVQHAFLGWPLSVGIGS